jgi:hypothetical protein
MIREYGGEKRDLSRFFQQGDDDDLDGSPAPEADFLGSRPGEVDEVKRFPRAAVIDGDVNLLFRSGVDNPHDCAHWQVGVGCGQLVGVIAVS